MNGMEEKQKRESILPLATARVGINQTSLYRIAQSTYIHLNTEIT
jgi:hypothetical protein